VLVTSSTGDYTPEREVFMADIEEDQYANDLPGDFSADENTSDFPKKTSSRRRSG
jgi:hypothetical protein